MQQTKFLAASTREHFVGSAPATVADRFRNETCQTNLSLSNGGKSQERVQISQNNGFSDECIQSRETLAYFQRGTFCQLGTILKLEFWVLVIPHFGVAISMPLRPLTPTHKSMPERPRSQLLRSLVLNFTLSPESSTRIPCLPTSELPQVNIQARSEPSGIGPWTESTALKDGRKVSHIGAELTEGWEGYPC